MINNIFRDKNGKVVIVQRPNTPMYVAFGFYLLRFMSFGQSFVYSEFGFVLVMIYWSYLEIYSGVNTWRKILGIVVLVYLAFSRIQVLWYI